MKRENYTWNKVWSEHAVGRFGRLGPPQRIIEAAAETTACQAG